jgi:ABC-type dipeptide/oligopeptide/nickel transport system permease component
MAGFVFRRLGFAVVTLFAVLTLVFFVVRILPGDPAMVILGDQASAATIAALRTRLGLDLPVTTQYARFILGALGGDWGTSMVTRRPVMQEVLNVLPHTLELTAVALVLGIAIGVPAGVWAAVNRNRIPDYVTRIVSLVGLSAPAFVSGIVLLLVFAIALSWFPVISGGQATTVTGRLRELALPATNLALIMAAYVTRVTRSAMLEVLSQDYVRTARAKGLSERRILYRHALRNALIPFVTSAGIMTGYLLGGAIVVEQVFAIPGLGRLILGAIAERNYPLVQATILVVTFAFVLVNFVVDLLYVLIDPRVRL